MGAAGAGFQISPFPAQTISGPASKSPRGAQLEPRPAALSHNIYNFHISIWHQIFLQPNKSYLSYSNSL